MRIRTFLKPLSFIPALLMMYVIFSFSSQEADLSSSTSFKVSKAIVRTADRIFDMGFTEDQINVYADRIQGATRKLAHMAEYFLLAVAVSFPLYVYGIHGILLVALVGSICIGFAAGDEYHQSFVAGRSASVKDVAIDSFGVLFGILLVRMIGWTGRRVITEHDVSVRETKRMRQERELLEKERHALEQERSRRAAGPVWPQQYPPAYRQGSAPPQYPPTYRQGSAPPQYPPAYGQPPYPSQYPPAYPKEPEIQEPSSDDLADDMPFANLLKRKK